MAAHRATSAEVELLSLRDILGPLDEDAVQELRAIAWVENYPSEKIIFEKGDLGGALYGIVEGRVGIKSFSEAGREIFLNIQEAGEIFGEIAVLDGKARTASAVTLAPSSLLRISRQEFLAFVESRPLVCMRLMGLLCERLRWTSALIETTIFLDIPRRLVNRLLVLAASYGTRTPDGTRIDIRLSQDELADMLGVTRESVNKGLRRLQQLRAISYCDGHIVLTDLAKLDRILHDTRH